MRIYAYYTYSVADDEQTGVRVAIKKVVTACTDVLNARRIVRELMFLRNLQHPNILALHEFIKPSRAQFESIYLVTQCMDTDLHNIIRSSQPLAEQHIQYFMYQLLCGLSYLHRLNILHRDIKVRLYHTYISTLLLPSHLFVYIYRIFRARKRTFLPFISTLDICASRYVYVCYVYAASIVCIAIESTGES